MQRNGCKINESHINTLALKARLDNTECGYLWKKPSSESSGKWQSKWFALFQNMLFYYENVNSTKPLGLIMLESCYCNRVMSNTKTTKEGDIKLFCFSISHLKDTKNTVELGAQTEEECEQWIESILHCSYNKKVSMYAEVEEKYLHLRQLYDTECATKWEHLSQIEELSTELKSLREELKIFKKQNSFVKQKTILDEESQDMKRLKKVQSLCKGWLYRKRWKRIVQDYIESPHGLNLRKRNRVVFDLVEKEGEYMSQLEVLVSNFLRPFKMAACSSKAPITHEEVNCIFLNSEILLFLHQIFYKGLRKKLENWPTLFIGDLFDFLLPVLVIYQEYVRNHHYSLQILTDLKSKSNEFRNLLKRYEAKCEGRSLDVYLTYPMHQIPRYILILHELIAYTSLSSQNELKSLENAKMKLEELSKTMHDEVSETENIRCNLAIEKMIVEGCECLLDSNQLFIREGLLIILLPKSKASSVKLKDVRKRTVVKCFLFSNHLIVTTRASNGRLNLFKPYEAIPLNECKLIEDVSNEFTFAEDAENLSIVSDERSMSSVSIVSNTESTISLFFNNREQPSDTSYEFKLIQSNNSFSRVIHLIASSLGEKTSWCGDISQCIDNLNYSRLFQNANTSNSVNMPNKEMPVQDSKLYKDEKDVKYCKTLNSCKIPQIRQATAEKLIERLTDLRFLSIDFLNTFLLTYRIFTDSLTVITALKELYESSPNQLMNDLITGGVLTFANGGGTSTQQNSFDKSFDEPSQGSKAPKIVQQTSNELNRRVSVAGLFRLPSINEENDVWKYSNNNEFMAETLDSHRRNSSMPPIDINDSRITKEEKQLFRTKLSPINSLETIDAHSSCGSDEKETIKNEINSNNKSSTPANSTPSNSSPNIQNKTNGILGNVIFNLTKNVTDGIIFSKQQSQQQPQHHQVTFIDDFESKLDCKIITSSDGNNNASSTVNINNTGNQKRNASLERQSSLNSNDKEYILSNSSINSSISSASSKATFNFGYLRDSVDKFKESFNSSLKKDSSSINTSIDTQSITTTTTYVSSSTGSVIKSGTNGNDSGGANAPSGSINGTESALSSKVPSSSGPTAPSTPNSFHKYSHSLTTNQLVAAVQQNAQKISKRFSEAFVYPKETKRLNEIQNKKVPLNVYAGVVVTSSRSSRRRISNCEATKAFAVATSGSQISAATGAPLGINPNASSGSTSTTSTTAATKNRIHRHSTDYYKQPSNQSNRSDRLNSAVASLETSKTKAAAEWTIVNTAASMRVLNVLRHWITKHPFDFDENVTLKEKTMDLINEMLNDQELTDTERKVAIVIRKQLSIPLEKKLEHMVNIEKLLAPPSVPGKVKFNELSVSEIAEQMTYIDYQILCSISSQELIGQAWMKPGKEHKARNVLLFSKRFNEMSQLVVSEIVSCRTHEQRLEKLEKWTTIANICKFLKNFNGVLQIMSAFATTSVFRLKKTWDALSKNSQQTIDTLQNLVSSDGRFKNLRDAMHKCDPPCIPYLGMYLMDLVFIEESTPDFLEENLVNFSKLRMVSHIIRDIRTFQQIKYTIHHNRRVCEYLLDTSGLLTPDEAYNRSLTLEPRTSININYN